MLQGGSLPCLFYIRREVVRMEMFTFQDLILFGSFLVALLAYIDRRNRRIQ